MMHVRGRAASKDDLELARSSALTQEKISFGVNHVEPMGGYGRPRTNAPQKRPATAQVRRPTRPSSGRVRPQSAQVARNRPASAPRRAALSCNARGDQTTGKGTGLNVPHLQRGRISPDLIDDAPTDFTGEEPPRIYDRRRGRSYLPPARAPAEGVAPSAGEGPAPRPITTYHEKVPRVGCAVPLSMPEVDGQELPGQSSTGPTKSTQGYPDVLLLESWMNEMAERMLVNKQQEVFSKVVFDRSLLSYTMDTKHGETEVHNMWSAAQEGLSRLGCTREQLYERHLDSGAVERLYRTFYIYSVGLPTAVRQITEAAAIKEPASEAGLPVLCLSAFLHLFMETLKSTHGDSIAIQVEDNFVSGVHARVQAYAESLDALKLEYTALQQRAAALQAEVDENGEESNVQKIQRMNEAIYDLQHKIKAMMKAQAAAIAQKEEELENAERQAMQAKAREAEVARLAAEQRKQAVASEKELQTEIERIQADQVRWRSDTIQFMERMVDETSKLRNEQWISSGGLNLPKHTHGSEAELASAHSAAVASIATAVAAEREDVAFKKERDVAATANKEHQRDRELQEERKAANEALLEQQRAVRREQDAKERLEKQLARAQLSLWREKAVVRESRWLSKQLALQQFAKFCILKRQLRITKRSLTYAEKAAEQAIQDKEIALVAQEDERDRRKNELGESLESQQKQLAATVAEVEKLKFELQDSKSTLTSKQELQRQIDAGHKKIRELLAEIERLNSVHSGEMATREMHIGRIEVQLQAAHSSKDNATAELRQARAEHVAYVAQASMRKDKLQAELDKVKSSQRELSEWKAHAEKRETADSIRLTDLEAKLADEQALDRDLQSELRSNVDRLEKQVRKAEFVAQRTQQKQAEQASSFRRELGALRKKIDDQADELAKTRGNLKQQKRLFNSMRDERDLMQSTCNNVEQKLVAEQRNVVDAQNAKSDAEQKYNRLRKDRKNIEDERDEAIGRMKSGEEIRKLLEQQIENIRLEEIERAQRMKIRRKAAMQADVFSTADVGVQASEDGPSQSDMLAVLEELRVAEAARDRAQKQYDETKKTEREAVELAVTLREEIMRLQTSVASDTAADSKRELLLVSDTAAESKQELLPLANASEAEAARFLLQQVNHPEIVEQGVDVQLPPTLPRNLSCLMHNSPPEICRHMSLKSILSIVRKLYAHCSQVLQECVGPSMHCIGECIYQFFELKYGRGTTTTSSTNKQYTHERYIYDFISNVLRHEHDSPALVLFARFAGVVEDVYSVQAFRFFLYVLSCLDATGPIDQSVAGRPKMIGSAKVLGSTVASSVPHVDQMWLSEDYAMRIFQKVMPDSRLVGIMRYELRSVLLHRPSRQDWKVTACIEHDTFLLKVIELWNEVTPTEAGGCLVKRDDMLLRLDDSRGVSEDIAALYLDRWVSLAEPAGGSDRQKVKTPTGMEHRKT